MIAISRVFNIEGLWEVLGEIGHESPPSPSPTSLPPLPDNKTDGPIQSSPDWPEIVDSQAPSPLSDPDPPSPTLQKEDADLDIGPEILLISTLTQIINNLFARKETPSTDAHTLLSFLSRHLVTLSRTRNILTILHNSTTPSSSHSSSSKPSSTFPNNQSAPEKKKKSNPQPTSVFASNPLKPALGILFGQFPELHLFVSPMPRGRSDAEVLYSGEREGGEVRFVSVVEVLRDECPGLGPDEERGKDEKGKGKGFGYREQRWCAVEVCDEGAGAGAELKGAFGMRGGMRGMGMERRGIGRGIGIERGSTETEVGNVAKVWGFGGRRV
ncbi:uncharacterized protein LY89DRAFT_186742 [Mollisia scopiformis]|uniref:Uncharacterized protein n=1 Tax=Mollisia scopiformis TaxID=149040 RepID=A0A194XTX9_MOLSC|nr:uncharacterized protein LY89DRAFT_186742 [Mollisia scopiformis]KUJ23596.1 hypothetical protein LY89DRAFT_186742 [Mollisia scopiformis]